MKLATLIFAFFSSTLAFAYPEMVRHGYVNCATCHISSTGGGVLNEYGRALSKEILANGKFFFEPSEMAKRIEEQEEAFMKGSVAIPKGFFLGGDARFLQLIQDNKHETVGRFITMQVDLEGAYSDGKRIQALVSLGRSEPDKKAEQAWDYFISRKHWLTALVGPEDTPDLVQLRFGRFFPAYGLNIADHSNVTRSQLGFDQSQETYNAEASYSDENWNFYATYILGRPDDSRRDHGDGGAFQVNRALGSNKVGWSVYFNKDALRTGSPKKVFSGPSAILGFSTSTYALLDGSWIMDQERGRGFVQSSRWGWEFKRGTHALLLQEYARPRFQLLAHQESYGVGLQYFPRVHWDFQVTVKLSRDTGASSDYNRLILFLVHYYL